jgi:tRNA (guanine-N7-)-methyltransferase
MEARFSVARGFDEGLAAEDEVHGRLQRAKPGLLLSKGGVVPQAGLVELGEDELLGGFGADKLTIRQMAAPRYHLFMHFGMGEIGIIYDLQSITERIDLGCLFPVTRPLEVELGSGDGSFLAAYAAAHPERNFIGVERLLGRVRKTERKARRAGLANLRCVRIESAYFLEYLLPQHCVSAIHIYFPDPWPKRKHRRHRLINEQFPRVASQALTPDGRVFLRTDDLDYFGQMLEVFRGSPLFREAETPAELAAVATDFERDFNASGIPTQRGAFERA